MPSLWGRSILPLHFLITICMTTLDDSVKYVTVRDSLITPMTVLENPLHHIFSFLNWGSSPVSHAAICLARLFIRHPFLTGRNSSNLPSYSFLINDNVYSFQPIIVFVESVHYCVIQSTLSHFLMSPFSEVKLGSPIRSIIVINPQLAQPAWSILLLIALSSKVNPSKILLLNGVSLLASSMSMGAPPKGLLPPAPNISKLNCQPTSSSKAPSIVSGNKIHRYSSFSFIIDAPTPFMLVVFVMGCILVATCLTSPSEANYIRLVLMVDCSAEYIGENEVRLCARLLVFTLTTCLCICMRKQIISPAFQSWSGDIFNNWLQRSWLDLHSGYKFLLHEPHPRLLLVYVGFIYLAWVAELPCPPTLGTFRYIDLPLSWLAEFQELLQASLQAFHILHWSWCRSLKSDVWSIFQVIPTPCIISYYSRLAFDSRYRPLLRWSALAEFGVYTFVRVLFTAYYGVPRVFGKPTPLHSWRPAFLPFSNFHLVVIRQLDPMLTVDGTV